MSDIIPAEFKGVKLTKDGKPDTRSKLGRKYAEYLSQAPESPTEKETEQLPSDPPQEPETAPEAPAAPSTPRLGSHQSAESLVRHIAGLYPDAKPSDWRTVQTVLQNAMRYGRTWANLTRKG